MLVHEIVQVTALARKQSHSHLCNTNLISVMTMLNIEDLARVAISHNSYEKSFGEFHDFHMK